MAKMYQLLVEETVTVNSMYSVLLDGEEYTEAQAIENLVKGRDVSLVRSDAVISGKKKASDIKVKHVFGPIDVKELRLSYRSAKELVDAKKGKEKDKTEGKSQGKKR